MFKSYQDLFSEPTVIILGAGASRDYGFPLWGGLKKILLEKCCKNPFPNQITSDALGEISSSLTEMRESDTVDKIATEFSEKTYSAFRRILGLSLIEAEAEDLKSKQSGWFEEFASGTAEYLVEVQKEDFFEAKRLMSNIRFVSLNYDRVFQHHYAEPLFKTLKQNFTSGNSRKLAELKIDGMPQQSQIGVFSIFQPHGIIAQHLHGLGMGLNGVQAQPSSNDNMKVIHYGDVTKFQELVSQNWIPSISVVDDFDPGDLSSHPGYHWSNTLLPGKRVFLGGLSSEGISNSKFDFSKVTSVGTSLSTAELRESAKSKLGSRLQENSESIKLGVVVEQMKQN